MNESKLVHFLRLFSPQEREQFQAYVDSPLFNRRNSLKTLLQVLNESCNRNEEVPSKEAVYQQVYGDKAYNDRSIRTAMAQLFALLRGFLAFLQYEKDEAQQQRYFLAQLNALEETRTFPSYYQKVRKNLVKIPMPSADRHYHLMLLEETYLQHLRHRPSRSQKQPQGNPQTHLIVSFLTRLLRYELRELSLAGSFTQSPSQALHQQILEAVSSQLDQVPLSVQLYSLLVTLLKSPQNMEMEFQKARSILSAATQDFSSTEANELYNSLLNYAARQLNDGHLQYLDELFALYQEMLQHKLLAENGKLSSFHYKNIANVAFRLQEFDWAQSFMQEWRKKVHPDHAENAYQFNLGMLHFYRQEYEQAARQFNHVLQDYQDTFYGLNARGYLLQIYYEQGETRSLESLAHSFRVLLSRSKNISDLKRQQYLAFIKHLLRLMNTPLNDRERISKLLEELERKEKRGMGTAWLKEKARKLLQ